ncbi:threonine ammonia-lyase [Rubrobacter taiwanensis]|uniref:L-threonine dehydratase catabolic TdcB n=1 Tax=Rubrobacter taiwanensis TaxID=185139 RepID=A0A4R1BDC5_9ACTN|nr:threonine ammonia-lyase [Rubrobacter taiwanensis]TCJ15070.1 threonine ammonia-lyase [Rubrobacter taiwanensis]
MGKTRTEVGLEEIREAAGALRGVAHRTPVLYSANLSKRLGCEVRIKSENLQRTGSFKIRGAYNRILRLSKEERERGVIAASAGNHAQGVALAASLLGVKATIVMPSYASLPKVEATEEYGAEVVLAGGRVEEALERAERLRAETGAVQIHPFDDPLIVAGQGTVGLEICEDVPDADRIIVGVGGGGLISGIAVAVKALKPEVEVVGVRPAEPRATIADGTAVDVRGEVTGPIIDRFVDEIVYVDEESVSEAIVLHLERTKQVVEGAGALPLAALLAGKVPSRGTSVLVVSGGNIDPGLLAQVIRHGLEGAGRYLFVRVQMQDRPGQLQRALKVLADMNVNVVSVVHHRIGLTLPVNEVEVELTLETRNREHAHKVRSALLKAGYRLNRSPAGSVCS